MSVALLSRSEIQDIIKETAIAVAENLRNDLRRDDGWVDKKGIALHIKKSPATVNRWMQLGMPHEKIADGHPRFRKKDVDRWLKERGSYL